MRRDILILEALLSKYGMVSMRPDNVDENEYFHFVFRVACALVDMGRIPHKEMERAIDRCVFGSRN